MTWNTPRLTWLITGASSGFGLALTRIALAAGHNVIATSRNPSRNPSLVSEIESQGGQCVALDVDDLNTGGIVDRLEKQGTNIDILVNNAGWSIHGPAESFSEEEVRRQMETVFFGPYRLIRAVVPYMRSRKQGMILNISSGAGLNGRESMGIYGGSKSAMDGLLRVMSKEIAPFNIRALTVYLGGFDTNFTNSVTASKTPIPEDYKGSMTEMVTTSVQGSNYVPDGDHIKASRVLYEMVLGEGFGAGKESETVIFLGRDMWKSVERADEKWKHDLETFKEVCNNVYIEK